MASEQRVEDGAVEVNESRAKSTVIQATVLTPFEYLEAVFRKNGIKVLESRKNQHHSFLFSSNKDDAGEKAKQIAMQHGFDVIDVERSWQRNASGSISLWMLTFADMS